jgi:hypothetical protein
MTRTHANSRLLISLVSILSCLGATQAFAHGVMRVPASRALGSANEDYQYCFGTPGCECGNFPDAGGVVATYKSGQTIEVTIDITQSHDTDTIFRFQLCPPEQSSVECFVAGEFASVDFDQTLGLHTYEITLPDVVCDPCVLRWKWDYAFLSCADVSIVADEVGVASPTAWAALKAMYR